MAASLPVSSKPWQSGRTEPASSPSWWRAVRCACLVLLGLSTIACGEAQTAPGSGKQVRVLFIGNSLTYVNDLPGMVEALATASGDRITQASVALPNYSLEDHWNDGRALEAISQGGWDVIVLQQGPSSLPASRVLLVDFAKRFAGEAARTGARVALYSVWPPSDGTPFDAVTESYEAAADSTGGLLFPAGEAWRAAWRRDPSLALYGNDGFHPTPLGSYLAALVMYQQLTGRSPEGLPGSFDWPGGHLQLNPAQIAVLGAAAVEANQRFARVRSEAP